MSLTAGCPLPSVTRRYTSYGRQLETARRCSPSSRCGVQGSAQERNCPHQPATETGGEGNGASGIAAARARWCRTGTGCTTQAGCSRCACTAQAGGPRSSGRSGRSRRRCRWGQADRASLAAAQALGGQGNSSPRTSAQTGCQGPRACWWQRNQTAGSAD